MEGKKVGVIAVKHFSDFTITQKSGTPVPTPSPTPTPTPENNYFWGYYPILPSSSASTVLASAKLSEVISHSGFCKGNT